MEQAWFLIAWDISDTTLIGPFGDKEFAKDHAKELIEGGQDPDEIKITSLWLEPV